MRLFILPFYFFSNSFLFFSSPYVRLFTPPFSFSNLLSPLLTSARVIILDHVFFNSLSPFLTFIKCVFLIRFARYQSRFHSLSFPRVFLLCLIPSLICFLPPFTPVRTTLYPVLLVFELTFNPFHSRACGFLVHSFTILLLLPLTPTSLTFHFRSRLF